MAALDANQMDKDNNETTRQAPEGVQSAGSQLRSLDPAQPWTLQEIVAAVHPSFAERLDWLAGAPVRDPTSTELSARSLYNRPGKEAAVYDPSVLAEHAKHVTSFVQTISSTATGPRTERKFEGRVQIEGRVQPIVYVRAITPSCMARVIHAREGRTGRARIGVLVNSDSTKQKTYGVWEAGVRNQQTDLMHTTTLAERLWSVLPLKVNEVTLMNNHVVWATDFLTPLEARNHAPVQFIVASAVKLNPKVSEKRVTRADGTSCLEYANTVDETQMSSTMESILNVAATDNITDLILGQFGYGTPFNHPANELAKLWAAVILDNADKWCNLGMKFHFAFPLGAGCPDEVWTAFQTAMVGHPAALVDVDGIDTSRIAQETRDICLG